MRIKSKLNNLIECSGAEYIVWLLKVELYSERASVRRKGYKSHKGQDNLKRLFVI